MKTKWNAKWERVSIRDQKVIRIVDSAARSLKPLRQYSIKDIASIFLCDDDLGQKARDLSSIVVASSNRISKAYKLYLRRHDSGARKLDAMHEMMKESQISRKAKANQSKTRFKR